jgi:anthranilate synthase component II
MAELEACEADAVVISPGPGAPEDAGVSVAVVKSFAGRVPLLGVCLGHQCIAVAYGGGVQRAASGPVHGKTSDVTHDGAGVFAGLASPLVATRYHSLAVPDSSVPAELRVTARSEDGTIMGLRHVRHAVEGVQFHPESVLTAAGDDLLANFLAPVSQPAPARA